MTDMKQDLDLIKDWVLKMEGDYYQMKELKEGDRSFTLEARHCPMLAAFRKFKSEHLPLCEAHTLFIERVAVSLDPRMRVRVTRSMNWGDDRCELTCQM